MTVRAHIYVVTCNRPGCTAEYIAVRALTAAEALADAQGDHWARARDGLFWIDLCPNHKDGDPR